jgi:hypothetical protein
MDPVHTFTSYLSKICFNIVTDMLNAWLGDGAMNT